MTEHPQKPTFPYSAARARENALKLKIRRNQIMCKGNNTDFKTAHPDWCRDGKQGNYLVMIKQTKEKFNKNEKIWKDRELRQHGN